jgi:hypothetical protein
MSVNMDNPPKKNGSETRTVTPGVEINAPIKENGPTPAPTMEPGVK